MWYDFLTQLGIILLLAILNGVFSMAELAVVSSRKLRLQQLAEDGDERAHVALNLAEHPNRFLSTVQVGITLIATLSGAIGGAGMTNQVASVLSRIPFLSSYARALAITLVVLLVTYLSLVVGELVPKRLALGNPEAIAALVARPMQILSTLGRPIIWLLSVSTEGLLRMMRVRASDAPPVTPEEITGLMEQGEEVGVFEEAETDIVESIFRLGDLRAGALMTPRTEMDWLDLDEPFIENLKKVTTSPHTWFPVGEGSLDNVTGIVRGKDLIIRAYNADKVDENTPLPESAAQMELDLAQMVHPAQFVPESMPALQLLEVLRAANSNQALVIDEYGGMLGLVSLFDVIRAIVGGISERGEPVQPEAIQREDGSWLVEGMMRIDAFKKLLDLDDLPDENRAGYQTVGGFIMAQVGAVPNAGDFFENQGWRFEVMDMDGLRVDKVLVTKDQVEEQ